MYDPDNSTYKAILIGLKLPRWFSEYLNRLIVFYPYAMRLVCIQSEINVLK